MVTLAVFVYVELNLIKNITVLEKMEKCIFTQKTSI